MGRIVAMLLGRGLAVMLMAVVHVGFFWNASLRVSK
jgi:uncharacterized membrane protein